MKSDHRLYERSDAVASRLRPRQRGCSEGWSVARVGVIDRSHSLRWALPRSQCVFLCNVYAVGPWCWLLSDPRPIEPIPMLGKLHFFETDDDLIKR